MKFKANKKLIKIILLILLFLFTLFSVIIYKFSQERIEKSSNNDINISLYEKTIEEIDLRVSIPSNSKITTTIISSNHIATRKNTTITTENIKLHITTVRYSPDFQVTNKTGGQPPRILFNKQDLKLNEIGIVDNKKIYSFEQDAEKKTYLIYAEESDNNVAWETSLWAENKQLDQTIISYSLASSDTKKSYSEVKDIILSLEPM